jgi:hypothetical protein
VTGLLGFRLTDRNAAAIWLGFRNFAERTCYARCWFPALPYAAFAVFAALVALLSGEAAHRQWGTFAAVAYAGAALASLWGTARARQVPLMIALTGAVLAPLGWLGSTGAAMPEVGVVERSAAMLLHHGQLYQSSGALAASHQVYGYDPYLPLMMVFGLPRALLGPGLATDPRVWDGIVFALLVAAALSVAALSVAAQRVTAQCGTAQRVTALRSAGRWPAARHTAFLVASPLIAFPLTVSGNDLPVIGLICLGLAFAFADVSAGPMTVRFGARFVAVPGGSAAAGVALGAAAAMKATAWPALLIVGVLFAVRDGRRTAGHFAVTALAVGAVAVGPVLATEPVALIQNTIMFPLGLTRTVSPAASPLPGHLLAATGPAGHAAAIALLVMAACVLAAVPLRRPPRTMAGAGWFLVLALAVMFTLAPATRWGYFVYPLTIGAWLLLIPQSPGTGTTMASCVDRAITTTASVSGEGFSSRCGTCGGTQT